MKCRCLRKMKAPPYSRDQLWPNHPNSGTPFATTSAPTTSSFIDVVRSYGQSASESEAIQQSNLHFNTLRDGSAPPPRHSQASSVPIRLPVSRQQAQSVCQECGLSGRKDKMREQHDGLQTAPDLAFVRREGLYAGPYCGCYCSATYNLTA